jgi:hypothetical protein
VAAPLPRPGAFRYDVRIGTAGTEILVKMVHSRFTRMEDTMRRAVFPAMACLILSTVVPSSSEARVVRFVVEQTRRIADGKSFGDVGPY